MDDDLSFESWEAVEDVYEEMLDEENELQRLQKAKALARLNDKRDPELTLDTDEEEDKSSEGTRKALRFAFATFPVLYPKKKNGHRKRVC